jgi:hypothetical protein
MCPNMFQQALATTWLLDGTGSAHEPNGLPLHNEFDLGVWEQSGALSNGDLALGRDAHEFLLSEVRIVRAP